MISQLSFFHLGHVTMKDAEPDINEVYGLLEVGSDKELPPPPSPGNRDLGTH